MYDQFVGMVAAGRHMDPDAVRALADGRAYTGRQALKLGLIDAIGDEQDAIVRFPGCGQFDAASSFIAYHRASRTAVGLILCSRVKNDVGHITQVCVLPEHRGKRIGEGLLAANLQEVQRRRFSMLSLTVTEANKSAVELYKRLGYHVARVFDAFVWEG